MKLGDWKIILFYKYFLGLIPSHITLDELYVVL